jgi:hypothetical protein
MQSAILRRAAASGVRTVSRANHLQLRGVANLATFKTPQVANEPNVCPHNWVVCVNRSVG